MRPIGDPACSDVCPRTWSTLAATGRESSTEKICDFGWKQLYTSHPDSQFLCLPYSNQCSNRWSHGPLTLLKASLRGKKKLKKLQAFSNHPVAYFSLDDLIGWPIASKMRGARPVKETGGNTTRRPHGFFLIHWKIIKWSRPKPSLTWIIMQLVCG